MATHDRHLRIGELGNLDDDADYLAFTPAERIAMVWPLTVRVWTLMSAAQGQRFDAESRLQRHHIRIQRREG